MEAQIEETKTESEARLRSALGEALQEHKAQVLVTQYAKDLEATKAELLKRESICESLEH